MKKNIDKIVAMILPYIGMGIFLILFVLGIVVFSYLLILGAIIGLLLFLIAYVRSLFVRTRRLHPLQQHREPKGGRIIEQDEHSHK